MFVLLGQAKRELGGAMWPGAACGGGTCVSRRWDLLWCEVEDGAGFFGFFAVAWSVHVGGRP